MKKILFIGFIIVSTLCSAQNFVPNPSFELSNICPDNVSQLNRANFWFVPTAGTSDYFNACDTTTFSPIGVPNNFMGNQQARTGSAYAGMFVSCFNYREYISVKLISPLIAGHYCISYYVSRAEKYGKAVKNIDCYISTDSISSTSYLPLNYSPQVENSFIITDTMNWTMVSGQFDAVGGELYLTIGNFHNELNTDGVIIDSTLQSYAYYYIDDVSLTACDKPPALVIPNVFTPNSDGVNDKFDLQITSMNFFSIEIFDRWGAKVFSSTNTDQSWDGKSSSGNVCDNGTYFYVILAKGIDDKDYSKRGFLTLLK